MPRPPRSRDAAGTHLSNPLAPPVSRATRARGPNASAAGHSERRVVLALAACFLAALTLRVLATVLPGRALWGLDFARDLPLAGTLIVALVTAVSCVPAVGRRLVRVVPERGAGIVVLAATGVVLLAAFVWNHPDRALFTGDTRLRQGSFVTVERPEEFAPQALPGDLLLHHTIVRRVSAHLPIAPGDVFRLEGALLVVITALAGLALARACGLSGVAALAVAAAACGTAALALCTGYAKASSEVAALTSVLAVGVARASRSSRGLALAGVSVAIALLLHRSALVLVPAWLAVAVVVTRGGSRRGLGHWLGLLAPPVVLVVMGPRLWQIASTFDRAHHLPGAASVVSPGHLADVANAVVLLAPAILPVPPLLLMPPRPSRREAVLMLSLVAPALLLLAVVRPQQGLPRDWDVFAFVGSACAAVVAWRAGVVFAATPATRSAAVAFALLALVPALQWTALQSDAARMWARAESILVGPHERDREERALGLATLGLMRYDGGEHEAARRLFRLSQEASPHPRRLVEWGIVASLAGRHAEALGYFEQAVAIKPDLASAWQGVVESAASLGDAARCREAVRMLEQLDSANPSLPGARRWLATTGGEPLAP